mgnify:FL=1
MAVCYTGSPKGSLMATSSHRGQSWLPETDAERDAIRQELERILASELFANSKRYPSLLKYIVEETLAGRAENLKERTIGIEVFGRDPSYDTNADPIVRISAAQVRHRLAQYYRNLGCVGDVQIELLPGSYVPHFRRLGSPPDAAWETQKEETATPDGAPVPGERRTKPAWLVIAGLLIVLGVLSWFVMTRWSVPDAVSAFWGPVWDASSIVVCVPGNFPTPENPTQTSGVAVPERDPGTPLSISESLRLNSITWPDATVLYSVVGFLQAQGKQFRVRRDRDLLFSEIRSSPAVMIGGPYNNQWLKRLTSRYRFTYEREEGESWIRDAENPSRRNWKVDVNAPYTSFDVDCGIVSRVWDPTIEHWVVVASGIASYGTIGAGEFLTSDKHLAILAQEAPKGWERKNLQVVFVTKVLNGNAGPPQILAIHVW